MGFMKLTQHTAQTRSIVVLFVSAWLPVVIQITNAAAFEVTVQSLYKQTHADPLTVYPDVSPPNNLEPTRRTPACKHSGNDTA